MKDNLFAVILAGGSGTRFWPLSRQARPKQLLKIAGETSLLHQTVGRILPLVKPDHILVMASREFGREIKKDLRSFRIPPSNIMLEPSGKNTAPSLAWSAFRIHSKEPDSTMIVLPADHLIENKRAFHGCLKKAVSLAASDYLVTLGIVPTRAETGYGYLKVKERREEGRKVHVVERFVEKPDAGRAKRYFKSGRYLWNSGMFVWKTGVIMEQYRRHQPAIHRTFRGGTSSRFIEPRWPALPFISVDYAILERAERIATVPAAGVGWSDLGSWESLYQVRAGRRGKNVYRGDIVALDNRNTLIWGGERLVAAVGLEGLVIVDTPDALLVCRKDASQRVREIVGELKKKKRRPWL